jgi:hypothetical protein
VFGLVHAYREFGHRIARLDPLSEPAPDHPLLDPALFGFGPEDLDRPIDPRPFLGLARGTLRELIAALRETYCGTLGVEFVDIPDRERREWLHERMEPRRNHPELAPQERERVLRMLLAADAFEQFLQVKYVGQKRFSLEGGATLIPMLDWLFRGRGRHRCGADRARRRIVDGSTLANVLGKPLELILAEFEPTSPQTPRAWRCSTTSVTPRTASAAAAGAPSRSQLQPEPSGVRESGGAGVGARTAGSRRRRDALARHQCWFTATPASQARAWCRSRSPWRCCRPTNRRHHPCRAEQPDRLHHHAAPRASTPTAPTSRA